jgi:hypothetical protein
MKNNLLIVALLVGFISCNTNQKNKETVLLENSVLTHIDSNNLFKDYYKRYELMKQKYYISHIEKPNLQTREKMIAPINARCCEKI